MGNVLLDDYKKGDPVESFDKWLQENPELTGKQILFQNKLFLAASFTYSSKEILLKVCFKRDSKDLTQYIKSFDIISNSVQKIKCSNILPLKIINAKEAAMNNEANLIMATRQYLQYTLQQKLQRRPYLNLAQKSWIIFQMIVAVDTVHSHMNLYHGNIRTSNFLVTNYEFLVLTDFANYKPTYILEDTEQGLAQFRLFYPSSIDKCNIAPQKLQGRNQSANTIKSPQYLFNLYKQSQSDSRQSSRYSVNSAASQKQSKGNKQLELNNISYFTHMTNLKKMDEFSLGLCILQVLNDGKSTFTYQNLLNMKKNKFSLQELISTIMTQTQCESKIKQVVQELLIKKTLIEPQSLYQKFKPMIYDEVHILIWHCLSAFTKVSFLQSDHRLYLLQSLIEFIEKQVKQSNFKFKMKRAKCLQSFNPLKIFVQMIKKKYIFVLKYDQNSILDKIVSFVDKKQGQAGLIQSDDELCINSPNQRQNYFINESKKKRITKRMSFAINMDQQSLHELCPPKFDSSLSSLLTSVQLQSRYSKLTSLERRQNRFQQYLRKIKQQQPLREQIIMHRTFFYQNYQIAIKIIYSCLRNCRYVSSKLVGIQLIDLIAKESRDETILKLIMPFLISLTQDSDMTVAKYAFTILLKSFYYLINPFNCEQDIAYLQIFIDFLLNNIKVSKIRIAIFQKFSEIHKICEWLQVHYLKFSKDSKIGNQKISFYRLVQQTKIYYGSFSVKQIQVLMQNIPIAILPQMFQFYISFLNTQKILGLKFSLFIAKNAYQQFQSQKQIIEVFDNCMQSGLQETGIGLYYSIIYFTIRKNTNMDIVKKIAPHIINPYLWVREKAFQYVSMCVQQFPPTKVYFLFRDIFQAPFPLTLQNMSQEILLPEPLTENDVDFKQRNYFKNSQRRKGLIEKRFLQYLKGMKQNKQYPFTKNQQIKNWMEQTRPFRQLRDRTQPQVLVNYMKKTLQLIYQNNFFYFVLHWNSKANQNQKEKGLAQFNEDLKKFSKFSLQNSIINQQQKQFFVSLYVPINSNLQKLLVKHYPDLNPQKLKLSLCINTIAQQIYILDQFKVKPTPKLGMALKKSENDKNIKPRGIKISQIYQHRDTISGLEKVGDSFFVSGSYDGTLRIFNTKKIQMNIVTDSDAVYEIRQDNNSDQRLKISCLSSFDKTYTAVVGTSKGIIKGFQLEKLNGKSQSKLIKSQNQTQVFKYNVNEQIQKLITLNNGNQKSQYALAYLTSDCNLGLQDIRMKNRTANCYIGKERGFCISLTATQNTLLVGTIYGYLLTYDIRCNIISSVYQLMKDNQPLPITNIIKVPNQKNFCLTYPSKNYQFCQFNIESVQSKIEPDNIYCGYSQMEQNIVSIPYMDNKTNQQSFKLCNNNLQKHLYYSKLSKFSENYKILDYVSEPLTTKQSRIRQVWANGCKHRYNQILSIYTKKTLPFVQYLNSGILTNFNPSVGQSSYIEPHSSKQLSLLVQKRQAKDYNDIQKPLSTKQNKTVIHQFEQQQNKDFLTCCTITNGFVVVGTKSSKIKIYK